MGSPGRIGRVFALGVIGVAGVLVVAQLPDDDERLTFDHPVRVAAPPASRSETPGPRATGALPGGASLPEATYQERLSTRIMFVHPRQASEGGAVYPLYPSISDATFARELRDVFVPMSALFDTTTLLDAIDRAGSVSPLRIDPQPFADSLLRYDAGAMGSGDLSVRFDVHGSLAGHVAPPWMVALARGTAEPLALTPWGSRGRERALVEGRRLASLVSDDTVPELKRVPFRVVSYDRLDVDSSRFIVMRAVREAKPRPGATETVGELVTLIGQSLGETDEFAPVWSSVEVTHAADFALEPVVAALRMGSARRPVLLIEVQADEDMCSGDRRGYFLALMDDGRWRDVGFWSPGC